MLLPWSPGRLAVLLEHEKLLFPALFVQQCCYLPTQSAPRRQDTNYRRRRLHRSGGTIRLFSVSIMLSYRVLTKQRNMIPKHIRQYSGFSFGIFRTSTHPSYDRLYQKCLETGVAQGIDKFGISYPCAARCACLHETRAGSLNSETYLPGLS